MPMEPIHVGEAGEPAVVEGTKGEWRVDPAALGEDFEGRTALLSPFDRLVHDRVRAQELFDFEYTLEMYKPAAKRRWGYFALPILHDDRLVGKVDATADRKASVLRVHAIHEDVKFTRTMTRAVQAELQDLASWLGLGAVETGPSVDAYVESLGTRRPSDEHSIKVASRRASVSGRFALTTQKVAMLRYEADWAANHSHAGVFRETPPRARRRTRPRAFARTKVSRAGLRDALCECRLSRRRHASLRPQLGDLGDVDRAPVAVPPARTEPLPVPILVDTLSLAVDPAEAERLVETSDHVSDRRPDAFLYCPTHTSEAAA